MTLPPAEIESYSFHSGLLVPFGVAAQSIAHCRKRLPVRSKTQNQNGKVTAVYPDRDRDRWFGGPQGIERLRVGMFTTFSAKVCLPNRTVRSVSGALYWIKIAPFNSFPHEGLGIRPQDVNWRGVAHQGSRFSFSSLDGSKFSRLSHASHCRRR
jgi:hypothetical protein